MARKTATVMRECLGLRITEDPSRLDHDLKTGKVDLAEAVNVDISNTGRIDRRLGYTEKRSEASHSLFVAENDCLFVAVDSLYRLNPDYSRSLLVSGLSEGARMSYGFAANTFYFCNGFEKGKAALFGDYAAWEAETYVGPTTDVTYSDPPIGHLVSYYGSRILIAQGPAVWASEPFAYSRFNLASNFVQERSRITMIAPVEDGVYIGTDQGVQWYSGKDFLRAERNQTIAKGVIEGTLSYAKDSNFIAALYERRFDSPVAIWTGTDGIYIGGPGGFIRNITEDRLTYPSAQRGSGVVIGDQFLTLLED